MIITIILTIIIIAAVLLTPATVAVNISNARNSKGDAEAIGAAFSYLIETAVSYHFIKMAIDTPFWFKYLIIAICLYFFAAIIIGAKDLFHPQRVE